jgi:type I restriction-modification system DNA methylase subunit
LVLDPACGTGGFLVKAYYQLLRVREPNLLTQNTHQEILNQLWGIDISPFPAHLAVINLAIRKLKAKSDIINIIPHDFFRCLPKQVTLQPLESVSLDEDRRTYEFLPEFDAVICNPPYTRQDDIGDERYRKHIRRVALSLDGKIDISSEAGIYAYFFTHTTHFLKENGMFGYIVSNSWCDAKFGKEIQKFFLDNFKIITIIEFDKRAFVDAAINTVIVIARKLSGRINMKERDSNIVKFIRIKSTLKPEEIEYLVNSAVENYEDDKVRITLKAQGELYNDNKWMLYLRAPRIFFNALKNEKMTALGNIVTINVGIITFANDFFILNKER